jgi:hypothetical protein
MDTAARARERHQARPGRRAVVAADLADLRGPVHGTVTLPRRCLMPLPPRRQDSPDAELPGQARALAESAGDLTRQERAAATLTCPAEGIQLSRSGLAYGLRPAPVAGNAGRRRASHRHRQLAAATRN